MKKEILRDLLKKYLRGEASNEETVLIDRWYRSLDKNEDDPELLNTEDEDALKNKIFDQIRVKVKDTTNPRKHRPFLGTPILKWAASVALLAIAGVSAYTFYHSSDLQPVSETSPVQETAQKEITNTTASAVEYQLSDGSSVLLKPNSSIEFPEVFAESKREVLLTGEAFFDVSKDKARPFIITTGDVTVKVLGTSFNIKAYKGEKEVTVAVKTGKVLVSKSDASYFVEGKAEEIILTPNQEVVYNTSNENFTRKLVDEPVVILANPTLFEMSYDGTPVTKIFEVLEENYGIDIAFDEEVLAGCNLTTSMSDEGLYERIGIICTAIGAQYEVTDSGIVISSNGCN